jgi:hypothetical protein
VIDSFCGLTFELTGRGRELGQRQVLRLNNSISLYGAQEKQPNAIAQGRASFHVACGNLFGAIL